MKINQQSAISNSKFLVLALLAASSAAFAQSSQVEPESISSYLSVEYHGTNSGFKNTPQGAYTCAFDRTLYVLNDAGLITVRLLNSTDPRFEMVSIRVDGDTKGEYASRQVTPRTASFYGSNKTAQTIYFTVFVRDLINNQIIECDPSVVNEPE